MKRPKQVLLCYMAYALAAAVSLLVFVILPLNRWLDLLSNTKWYFPGYSKMFLPALFLTGGLALPVMIRIRRKSIWILAALGHGVVVAIGCYHLVYLLDGSYELIVKPWRFHPLHRNLLFQLFVGAGPLLGWLYSGILWGGFALVSAALVRLGVGTFDHPRLKKLTLTLCMIVFLVSGGLVALVSSATILYEAIDGGVFDGTLFFDEVLNWLLVLMGVMLVRFGWDCWRQLRSGKENQTP